MSSSLAWKQPSRELIVNTLYDHMVNYLGNTFVTYSRRIRMFNQVTAEEQPAFFMVDHQEEKTNTPRGVPQKLMMQMLVYIYAKAPDGEIGGVTLNNLLDAIDASLAPPPSTNVQELILPLEGTRLVNRCWINGVIMKDPGDLDGQAMARIPIQILVP